MTSQRAMNLQQLETPRLVLDTDRMDRNLARLRARLDSMGVPLRHHAKTHKCIAAARRVIGDGPAAITVSTLKEAEYFAGHGIRDILYAVAITPGKLDHVARIRAGGVDLAIITDDPDTAAAVGAYGRAHGVVLPTLIEIDSDGHRAGVRADDPLLLRIGRELGALPGQLRGVMTHAGDSYNCRSEQALVAMAEQERRAVVDAAQRLRAAGLDCPVVSVGSTPTAHFARDLSGVTEVRAGVYVFFDLVMAGIGVCDTQDIALSVLTSVIGQQRAKNWLIVDAGWMAMSRDRGTAAQSLDQGYGIVCDIDCRPLPGLIVSEANQEHGVITQRDGAPIDFARYPVGTMLRVLPNHACATAAQHPAYELVAGGRDIHGRWERFSGW